MSGTQSKAVSAEAEKRRRESSASAMAEIEKRDKQIRANAKDRDAETKKPVLSCAVPPELEDVRGIEALAAFNALQHVKA